MTNCGFQQNWFSPNCAAIKREDLSRDSLQQVFSYDSSSILNRIIIMLVPAAAACLFMLGAVCLTNAAPTPIEGYDSALEMIARAADYLRNDYSEATFDQVPDDMEEGSELVYEYGPWDMVGDNSNGEQATIPIGEEPAMISQIGPKNNSITGVNTGKTGERAFSIAKGSHNRVIGVNTKTAEKKSFRINGGSRNLINSTNSGTAGHYSFSIGEGQAQISSYGDNNGRQYIAVQPEPEQTDGQNQYVGGGYRPRPSGPDS